MAKPLLHPVFGGEVKDSQGMEFTDVGNLVACIFPSYKTAPDAWRGASHAHVDAAHVKYVIVHLHRMLDPEKEEHG